MKKLFLLFILVSFIIGLTACAEPANQYVDVFEAGCEVEKGALTCSPVKAYYSDGSDDEDTGASIVEGSLVVTVGIANGLDYPKSIRAIKLTVTDEDGKRLARTSTYDLETPLIVPAGEVGNIQCVYSVEKVKRTVSLDHLITRAVIYHTGVVLDGDEPASTKNTVTAAIEKAYFVNSKNYEMNGSIKIKNNYDHTVTPEEIHFWVKTQDGEKLHNTELMIANETPIEPGKTITLPFTITANDAADDLDDFESFDYLIADYDIKLAD
jgi:hypothetical protein